jgi:chromosome segregation ATPase
MLKGYSDVSESIDRHVHRLEDLEDEMQVCQNDVDSLKIRLTSVESDVRLLDASSSNAHQGIEDLGDRVDGFVSSLWTYNNRSVSSHRALFQEVHQHKREARADHESLLARLARSDEIIDRKFVQMDTEVEKVVGLVGEKIEVKFSDFSDQFMEAVEAEESRRVALEEKVAFLEEKLTDSLLRSADLVNLVLALQGRIAEVEDAVMEESEGGEEVVSSSSSDLDPVENMVAIPIPGPSVIHTLVAINEEFVPPVLRSSPAVPSTPSPEYVQALEDDPAHDGTPEYWADPEVGADH